MGVLCKRYKRRKILGFALAKARVFIKFVNICLQGPKSQVTYDIAGDGDAPEFFFVHPSRGQIIIAKPLTADTSRSAIYRLRVLARDQGSPQQTGTAVVTVNVQRNRFNPVFQNADSYQQTIAETFTPSVRILTVTARDQDPEVRTGRRAAGRFHVKATAIGINFYALPYNRHNACILEQLHTHTHCNCRCYATSG